MKRNAKWVLGSYARSWTQRSRLHSKFDERNEKGTGQRTYTARLRTRTENEESNSCGLRRWLKDGCSHNDKPEENSDGNMH